MDGLTRARQEIERAPPPLDLGMTRMDVAVPSGLVLETRDIVTSPCRPELATVCPWAAPYKTSSMSVYALQELSWLLPTWHPLTARPNM